MRSINKVIVIGNLTRDPETRQTANGQTVTTFCVATNREWITKDSNKHSLAEYHDVVAWARLAEICSNYLKKGKLVYIEGYLKTRSWDTPEGVRKFKTEIVAQDMIMLEKRPADEEYIPTEDTITGEHEEKEGPKTEVKESKEKPKVKKEEKSKKEEKKVPQTEEPNKEPEKSEEKESKNELTADINTELDL